MSSAVELGLRFPSKELFVFVAITNSPRPYAWGSRTAISELLGSTPTGGPEAELWLGSHPGSPAKIVSPVSVGGAKDLLEWMSADPATSLGSSSAGERLPFLLKVLAAERPLSLQAHPDARQAGEGFERENAAGTPLDAPERNYRDAYPKPEVIVALEDGFEALCGFRPLEDTRLIVERMLAVDPADQPLRNLLARLESLPDAFAWLCGGDAGVSELLARVLSLAKLPKMTINGTSRDTPEGRAAVMLADAFEVVRLLADEYPGDPGIVSSLLLNHVTLKRGEALFLQAGNIHAYLRGIGIEIMTASDNVLRGGLTSKHVDVPELLSILDFSPGPVPYLSPTFDSPHLAVFRPEVDDFRLDHVTGDARVMLTGPAIALCTSGAFSVDGAVSSASVARGEAVYITPEERTLDFTGEGEVFIATTP